MSYNFDILPDRRSSESVKWHAFDEDVLPMWVADMDFLSPEPVIRALRERVDHGVFGYPGDNPALINAIRNHLESHFGWAVEPESIILVPGVVTGFNWVCGSLAKPGEGSLIQTPVYPPFLYAASNSGLLHQEMQLTCTADGKYEIDYEAFEAAITPETRIFILCNPHNPVGRVFTREELEKMAQICLRHNVIICSDEIHCDLIFTGHRHIPIASLGTEISQNTVTLMAPSKTYNIAGLECSFAVVTNPELRKRLDQGRRGIVGFVNLLAQTAALAAYTEGQPWLDYMLTYIENNRDALYNYVNSELPGVKMWKPEGTYLAWLDCNESGIGDCPQKFFLDKARVALNDGSAFGRGGENFIRLNFGCPQSMMMEALERMRMALQSVTR